MPEETAITSPTKLQAIKRGAHGLCPHCGSGRMFVAWYTTSERCSRCGLEFEPSSGGTFVFNYIGSAGITGLLVILMYIIIRPESVVVQSFLFVTMLVLLIGTMPQRKGAFIALDYLIRRATSDEKMPESTLCSDKATPSQDSPSDHSNSSKL